MIRLRMSMFAVATLLGSGMLIGPASAMPANGLAATTKQRAGRALGVRAVPLLASPRLLGLPRPLWLPWPPVLAPLGLASVLVVSTSVTTRFCLSPGSVRCRGFFFGSPEMPPCAADNSIGSTIGAPVFLEPRQPDLLYK